jgi:putative ABC transport system permease protein
VVAAVAVGVTAVVGVRGFLNGLQGQLLTGFTEGTLGAIQIHAKGFLESTEAAPLKPSFVVDDALLARIEAVPGVTTATPRVTFPAMINVGDATTFALVTGVDPVREPRALIRRKSSVIEKTWLAAPSDVLVGLELARGLGAKPGAEVAIIGNDVDGVMNALPFTFTGRLAAFTQGEKKLVLIPFASAQELVRMPGRATQLAVGVDDITEVDRVAAEIAATLGVDYDVKTWREIATFADDVISTQNAALDLVTTIFLIVILFGLANALLASVFERVREIGTMIAVGARRRQVLQLFVLESVLLALVGALVGVALGFALVTALGVNGVELTTPGASLPQVLVPSIGPRFLVRIVAITLVGAVITALWPAWRASRLRPVEALAAT